ncbi:DNA-binding protein [Paenibacillus albidus]|nr:DNA-binding protein [Paenibacillus albidus]
MVGLDLENIDDIDVLTKMLKLTYSNEDWLPMIDIADKLYKETCVIYFYQREQAEEGRRVYKGVHERSLLYYFGFSQLAKGISLQKQGRYPESRDCISKYQDLSWLDKTSVLDNKIIEDFRVYAIGNTYTLDLLEGKEESLPDYIEHIKSTKTDALELLAGIITILEAALKNNFVIDWVLEEFSYSLNELKKAYFDNPIKIRYFTEYLYLFSLYNFKQKDYSVAIQNTLEALAVSVTLKDNTAFKKMVVLFEAFREHATQEQEQSYRLQLKTILEGVLTDEKNISFIDFHSNSN